MLMDQQDYECENDQPTNSNLQIQMYSQSKHPWHSSQKQKNPKTHMEKEINLEI